MIELIITTVFSVLVIFYLGYFSLSHFVGGKPLYGNDRIDFEPKVSLVIASYNEENKIKKKIENICELDYPKEKIEIIIVDSSTDGTREIIKQWITETDFLVNLIEEDARRGLATALNTGYASATGDIVIKNDVDILLEKESIRELVKYFADPKIGGVGGALQVSNKSNVEIGYRSMYDRLRLAESNLDSTYIFEPLCAYRKELIVPIDPSSVADDCELALKIRKQGFKTVFSPTAVAFDNSPTALKSRLSQKSRRAQGHIRLILQNLNVIFNASYGRFGLIIFPANAFMMLISPWMILSLVPLSFLFFSEFLGAFVSLGIVALLVITVFSMYATSKPKIVSGFFEAQLALVIGSINLLFRGPDFMWAKEKDA